MSELPRWYRSWPAPQEIAEKNLDKVPHVVDNLPKLLMTDQNYQRVDWPNDQPGFCMLEWDVALDGLSQRAFAAEALLWPREILVAPYQFHDAVMCWAGNDGTGPDEDSRPLHAGCLTCGEDRTDSFGLGCIYIPQGVLREFLPQMDHTGFTDYTLGRWYREHRGRARVTWRVRPQHLHDYSRELDHAHQ